MAPDPIAPHSAPIAAYMSVHTATNLAYVRYFANQDSAESANFESLNSRGFTMSYILPGGSKQETFIGFKTPLTKREEIRPVLEAMAQEAEKALGLPSSLSGPPPLAAIAKAAYASATDIYTPAEPAVPLDIFYPVSMKDVVAVGVVIGLPAILGYATDASLARISILLELREKYALRGICQQIFRGLVAVHSLEASIAFITCLRRGWYSSFNTIKWTLSTFVFGVGSMSLLRKHGRQVRGE
ncbi:hypothetical protein BDB00DRAFT_965053 [Zychaea mexicana]|uniref:uncharacterized protein n=1 Tax=Zychaea mexicana TaxID=64656 RepID=UPI0022FE97E3|nr:uncharacterized protein BDB00DRAFT_965053 [Zychaea mexicana]KAI9484656.1 hypothetical protein BDB00DRAFT_965053 [Zychaea mexicana]